MLKGVPLSQRIYADPGLRDVGDIDLLIEPGMEETADRVLLAAGFHRNDPIARLTPRRRRSWRKHGKDYTYRADDENDFEIDLHWRLFRNPHMPGNALADPAATSSEQIHFGETVLDVLPIDRSFLYLCVHGALDGWGRFKSLVDVAVLWNSFTSGAEKCHYRSGRCIRNTPRDGGGAQARTGAGITGRRMRSAAAIELESDSREAQWILNHARTQQLAQRFQPTQDGTGSWPLKRYELGLRRGLAYRIEILRRVLLRPRVWQRFDLPDALFPLYTAAQSDGVGVLSSLGFTCRRGARTAQSMESLARSVRVEEMAAARSLRGAADGAMLAGAAARAMDLPLDGEPCARRPCADPAPIATAARKSDAIERIRWAVLTVARYGPLSFVCFPQALAAHAMLRRRGISSIMHYGVRRSADRRMRAHTWLEVDHRMLLGGESAVLFEPIHSTGGEHS